MGNIGCSGGRICLHFVLISLCLQNGLVTEINPQILQGHTFTVFFKHAGVSEKCLKVQAMWQFDQQFSQVISSGRHKPTPVSAQGCCKMSPYYLSAAKAEGCVVRQAFGKRLGVGSGEEETHLMLWRDVAAGIWALACRGGGILNEWTRTGLNSQGGCGAETASTHRRLWIVLCSYSILPLPAVHLNATHRLTLEPFESMFAQAA